MAPELRLASGADRRQLLLQAALGILERCILPAWRAVRCERMLLLIHGVKGVRRRRE